MWQAVSRLLSGHFDQAFTIREKQELAGGEVHQAWCVSDGDRKVFIKCDTPDFLQDFKAEADQLECLARSHTVRTPQVYGVGSTREASFLLLEYLPVRPLDAHNAYLLGQQLARLHQWSEQPQLAWILTTTFQPLHNLICGSAVGRSSLPSNVLAGSSSLRRKKAFTLVISTALSAP